jgi:hypothetical protein
MYIPAQLADQYASAMARPEPLVFVTEANQHEMQAELAARRAACKHDWEKITTPAVGKNPEVIHEICRVCMLNKADLDAALAAMKKDTQKGEDFPV